MTQLPLVTISSHLNCGEELVRCLVRHGYCYIRHPLLPADRLHRCKRLGRSFFTQYWLQPSRTEELSTWRGRFLSDVAREQCKTDCGFRGVYQYVGASGEKDLIHCLSLGNECSDPFALRDAYYFQSGWERDEYEHKIRRVNPWKDLCSMDSQHSNPSSSGVEQYMNFMKELKQEYTNLYDACHEASMDCLRNIAHCLGVRPNPEADIDFNHFSKFHGKRDCNLEVKYYSAKCDDFLRESKPLVKVRVSDVGTNNNNKKGHSDVPPLVQRPRVLRRKAAVEEVVPAPIDSTSLDVLPRVASNIRLDTHKDLSSVTLLVQDAMGGLEVFDNEAQQFVLVPLLDDAVLVNCGTFLEKWTNGLLEATPHRVVFPKKEMDRCSVVFFCFPDHDASIEPLSLSVEDAKDPLIEARSFLAGDLMPMQ